MTDLSPSYYLSTRGGVAPVPFDEAVLMGLADDGGLLLPARIPDVRDALDAWRRLDWPDLAVEVIAPFVGPTLPRDVLHRLIDETAGAFDHPEVTPVRQVGPVFVLELFHGPTLAFKDVALQFLGRLFEYLLARRKERLNILGATSGDTGSAAIHGVRGRAGMHIFIMFPNGRVSRIQELQMTTVTDPNVHNIAIEGTFDDGQRVLKEVFNDLPFKRRYRLGAVNSVNWARILAQTVYYFHAAFRVQEKTGAPRVRFCVPTGNFGDIFAGYIAMRMGAPIAGLILATNENDILARFFNTGEYRKGTVRATLSPSMDIQVASNFERYLYYRLGEDPARVRTLMEQFQRTGAIRLDDGPDPVFVAGRAGRRETLDVIRRWWREFAWLPDPHTAVGLAVAERFLSADVPVVCLATAHPAKFPDAVREALGEMPVRHPVLDALEGKPTRRTVLPPERDAVERFIVEELRKTGEKW